MKIIIALSFLFISVNSLIITCEFENVNFNDWKKRYSCKTIKYSMAGDSKIVESIYGIHLNSSYSHENVTQYSAKGLKIEQFPEQLGGHFVNLEVIRMASCDLKILYKSSLEKLENLKYLDLLGNRIENLESDVFENTPNLIEVWLNNNRLKFVGSKILNPLKSLKVINFGGNTCIGSNSRYSNEDLERLKIELRLKCSDVSMHDLMTKMSEIEQKFDVIFKELRKLHEELSESKKIFRPVDFHD